MRPLLFGAIACILLTSLAAGPSSAAAPAKKGASAKKSVAKAPALQGGPRVSGIELIRDGKPYVARAVVSDNLRDLDAATAKAFLATAKAAGAQVVVTRAFTCSETGLLGPEGRLNDAAWGVLDDLLAAARSEGVGLLLTLTNPSDQRQFAAWVGSANPGVFFRDFRAQGWFKGAVKALLTRVNPKTKKSYASDPTLWGLVLCDRPLNMGGSKGALVRWVSETAALVKGLAPQANIVVGLEASPSEGVDPALLAGAAGVEYAILRLPKGAEAKAAADWALKTGCPVVALFPQVPTQPLGSGVAGIAVASDQIPEGDRVASLRQAFSLVASVAGGAGLITSLDLTEGPAPFLRDAAKAKVSVKLAEPAKISVRYGQGGSMEGRLQGPLAEQYDVEIPGLTADKDVSVQVEALKADGTVVLSDRRSLHLPKVASLVLNPAPESKNFITVKDGRFYDGDKPWKYVGTNNYYLNHIDVAKRDSIYADARACGMKVMRVWGFGEAHPDPIADWEKVRFFTLAPGKFDEENFKRFDDLVASAGKHGMRLIIALANNWADYGGAPQWGAYFGYKDKDDFFDKPEVQKAFREFVTKLVTRVNTVTGVAYKDDPTIFAWDLMNEPQYKRDQTGRFLKQWIADMSLFLKKDLGVRQLVTTGMEGHRASNGSHYSGTDYLFCQDVPSIDFATYHIYPAGEYARWNLETTKAVITRYVQDGRSVLKKPVVMEEYGIGNTDPKYDKPLWLRTMTKTFFDAGGDGVNYWMIIDPEYRYGDGNEFDRTKPELANIFAVSAQELEGKQ